MYIVHTICYVCIYVHVYAAKFATQDLWIQIPYVLFHYLLILLFNNSTLQRDKQ